jgi:hypothetical protein
MVCAPGNVMENFMHSQKDLESLMSVTKKTTDAYGVIFDDVLKGWGVQVCVDHLNKFWGDQGFIHLCFDVIAMDDLKKHVQCHGLDFSVDSNNTFAMDTASGRFCYIEDPDGTLIELVETHKVPILKKVGWYLDLRKRDQEKPLPDWMIKMLALSKVK